MKPSSIIFGMLPIFLFSVLTPVVGGVGWAAVIGLVAAVAVVAGTAKGGIKELPAAQAVLLLGMAVIGFLGDRSADVVLVHYGPAILALALGVFAIATARTAPFTAQFARGTVPPELWHNARFLDVNRRVSTAWGLAILFQGVCHIVGAQIGVEGMQLAVRICVNQVVPLLALLVAGVYTKRVVGAARAAHEAYAAHESRSARPAA